VALLVSSSLGSLGTLVLRIRQPVTSLRLRGTGGHGGRRTARRITGWTSLISWTALAGIAAAVTALHTGGADPAALAACVAVEMTVFCAVVYAVYLMENTNGAVLSTTLGAALAGLAGTTVVAVLVIPALSAVGAVLALIAGLATKSTVLHVRLRHRERPRAAAVPVLERAG
jgi:hypothetical protein